MEGAVGFYVKETEEKEIENLIKELEAEEKQAASKPKAASKKK